MRIIAVLAHPDDELGCVGTLAKHAQRGDEVLLAFTTLGENASHFVGIPHAEVKRVREGHARDVAELIGAKVELFDMGDTRLAGSRTEALEIARLYARFQPDAVITWDDFNSHPDHRATAKIAYDAITLARIPKVLEEGEPGLEAHRKPVQFYQYFTQASHFPGVFIDVSSTSETSIKVLDYYRSFYGWEFTNEAFLGRRRAIGMQAGLQSAERFSVRRAFHPPLDYLV